MRFLIVFYLFFSCVLAAELENNSSPISKDEALILAETHRAKVTLIVKKNRDIAHYLGEAQSLMEFANYSKKDAIDWVTQASTWIQEQTLELESLMENPNKTQSIFSMLGQVEMYNRLNEIIQELMGSLDDCKTTCAQLEKSLGLKTDTKFGSPKHSDGESSDDETK